MKDRTKLKKVFNNQQNVELDLPENNGQHLSLHISKVKHFMGPEDTVAVGTTKLSSNQ
jgi:hypothetical protein